MKMRNSIAMFIIAIVLALFAFTAKGQNPNSVVPPGLPTSLPMFANTNDVVTWLITNQPVNVNVFVHYVDIGGTNRSLSTIANPTKFSSYGAYQNFVATNAVGLVNWIKTHFSPSSQPAWIEVGVYTDPVQPVDSISLRATNTSLNAITSTWVSNNLAPNYIWVNIPVPGLQRFTISMSNPSYAYSWNSGSQPQAIPPPPIYPAERTTANWLVLNYWYCLKQYRTRFKVVANGVSQDYTQNGSPLLPPALSMPDPADIQITMTPGSDTTVQFTDNVANGWVSSSIIGWTTNTGFATVSVNQLPQIKGNKVPPSLQRFFRAFSN